MCINLGEPGTLLTDQQNHSMKEIPLAYSDYAVWLRNITKSCTLGGVNVIALCTAVDIFCWFLRRDPSPPHDYGGSM